MGMPPPIASLSPPISWQREDPHWRHFDNSVNALSFGFVATAILIFMFLLMALFERFIRPPTPTFISSRAQGHGHLPMNLMPHAAGFHLKLATAPPSPKMPVYAREVSVLMPGENIPTFIAQPAPTPCPPERIQWLPHQHLHISSASHISTSNETRITNAV